MDSSKPRIVIAGAGSLLTLRLFRDFYRVGDLWGSELVLYDIDEERLKTIYAAIKEQVKRDNLDLKVSMTTSKVEALENSDFVIVAVRVGGLRATRAQIEIPFRYGAESIVGDSTGPSGILKAITEIPAILDLAWTLEDVSPNAMILNHTNPVTAICTAVHMASKIDIVGLCHGYPLTKFASAMLDLEYESLKSTVAGINHLTWVTEMTYKDQSIVEQLKEAIIEGRRWSIIENHPYVVGRQLIKTHGMLISVTDRHSAEFFHYLPDWMNDPKIGSVLRRCSHVIDYEKGTLSEEYISRRRDAWRDMTAIVRGLKGHGASELFHLEIISSIVNDTRRELRVANIPNRSYIQGIKDERIVEVPCIVDKNGLRGRRVGRLTRPVLAILNLHLEKSEILAQGIIEKDKELILEAMGMDPTTPSPEKAEKILDEYLSTINPLGH